MAKLAWNLHGTSTELAPKLVKICTRLHTQKIPPIDKKDPFPSKPHTDTTLILSSSL
jgi:hypothetical protein